MRYSAINQIFWGLIIVFADFNINGIDILPDFIGMIIAVLALPKLQEHSELFERAYKFGIISLILDILIFISGFFLGDDLIFLGLLITTAGIIIFITFLWNLLNGLAEMAVSHNVPDTAEKLYKGRNSAIISSVLGLIGASVFLMGLSAVTAVLLVTGLILYIYTLYTIRLAYTTILQENRKDNIPFGG